ncbi:MAG: hypothetical protein LBI28_03710 [Treponema sp.]|nr:hypothetical protein [Treponema sp.]
MAGMKIEEIRSALEEASQETLADALAIVLTEGKSPSQAIAGMDKPELANFAQAVMYLKKNYDFEELGYLTTEADLVYVNAGDRRILLTDRMNTLSGSEGNSPGSQIKETGDHEKTNPSSAGGRFSNLEI